MRDREPFEKLRQFRDRKNEKGDKEQALVCLSCWLRVKELHTADKAKFACKANVCFPKTSQIWMVQTALNYAYLDCG